jgi:hypothetical protein
MNIFKQRTVKVLFTVWGNYACYKGNEIQFTITSLDHAILWIKEQLLKGNKLSKRGCVQQSDIEKYHADTAKYIIR